MKTQSFQTIILEADENSYLTQVAEVELTERVVATRIALGKYDNPENWKEISKAEGDEIKKQQEELAKASEAEVETAE